MSGRILSVTTAEYHADPCEKPSLSASCARELISRSPLHAWQFHPRLGGLRREPSKAMGAGTLAHAVLLGKGMDKVVVLDVDNFKTKRAQADRDAAVADGMTVVRRCDLDAATDVAEILTQRLADMDIVLSGDSEVKFAWTERTTNGEIECRGMMDHLVTDTGVPVVYEVKTTQNGKETACARSALDYGYDIQEAAYRSALEKFQPLWEGRVEVVFLFCELDPPYAVTPLYPDGFFRAIGERKWERACRTWARCLKTDVWPSYVSKISPMVAPPWAMLDVELAAAKDEQEEPHGATA